MTHRIIWSSPSGLGLNHRWSSSLTNIQQEGWAPSKNPDHSLIKQSVVHKAACEATTQWVACNRGRDNWDGGRRCFKWRNIEFGGQCMVAGVHWQFGCLDECRRHSGLFCALKSDTASGSTPGFLVEVPGPINSFMLFPQNRPLSVWPTGNTDHH